MEISPDIQRILDCRDAVLRLQQNPDYKLIIEDGFFKGVAEGLINSLAYTCKGDSRALVYEKLAGISFFKSFLEGIVSQGARAEEALHEDTTSNNDEEQ